jgi:transposase
VGESIAPALQGLKIPLASILGNPQGIKFLGSLYSEWGVSLYKIFNYILYVLHTGIQWEQLKTNRKELHYTNVYKWHNRWSKAGSYQALFEASVMHLHHTDQLDTSVLHGDGSNTVVKKGAKALATPAINTRKATKSSPS